MIRVRHSLWPRRMSISKLSLERLSNHYWENYSHNSRVSCQKGPTRHAYAWQIGPFWQDTLELCYVSVKSSIKVECGTVQRGTVHWIRIRPKELARSSHFGVLSAACHQCFTNILEGCLTGIVESVRLPQFQTVKLSIDRHHHSVCYKHHQLICKTQSALSVHCYQTKRLIFRYKGGNKLKEF